MMFTNSELIQIKNSLNESISNKLNIVSNDEYKSVRETIQEELNHDYLLLSKVIEYIE